MLSCPSTEAGGESTEIQKTKRGGKRGGNRRFCLSEERGEMTLDHFCWGAPGGGGGLEFFNGGKDFSCNYIGIGRVRVRKKKEELWWGII